MNPIIEQNLKNTQNMQNSNNMPSDVAQYFNTLPKFLQENIKQSGTAFNSVQDLQQVANQILKGNS